MGSCPGVAPGAQAPGSVPPPGPGSALGAGGSGLLCEDGAQGPQEPPCLGNAQPGAPDRLEPL